MCIMHSSANKSAYRHCSISQVLVKIEIGSEGDQQIAFFIGVGIQTINSTFTQLRADQARLQGLLGGLKKISTNLTASKTIFLALRSALLPVAAGTQLLLDTWSDIQKRLAPVKDVDRKLTESELSDVVAEWTQAQAAATAYVDAVGGRGPSPSALPSFATAETVSDAGPMLEPAHEPFWLPQSKGELDMAHLSSSAGINTADA